MVSEVEQQPKKAKKKRKSKSRKSTRSDANSAKTPGYALPQIYSTKNLDSSIRRSSAGSSRLSRSGDGSRDGSRDNNKEHRYDPENGFDDQDETRKTSKNSRSPISSGGTERTAELTPSSGEPFEDTDPPFIATFDLEIDAAQQSSPTPNFSLFERERASPQNDDNGAAPSSQDGTPVTRSVGTRSGGTGRSGSGSRSDPHWIGAPPKQVAWSTPDDDDTFDEFEEKPTPLVVFKNSDEMSYGGTTLTNATLENDRAKKRCIIYGIAFLLLLVILAVVIGVFANRGGGGGGGNSSPASSGRTPVPTNAAPVAPTLPPTPSPTTRVDALVFELREIIINNFPQSAVALDDVSSPQSAALRWLTNWIQVVSGRPQRTKILQLYALVTFYYALNGQSWTRSQNWIDPNEPECTWAGISCKPDGSFFNHVEILDLFENNMIGTFPMETALLTNLQILNVRDNGIRGGLFPVLFESWDELETINIARNRFAGLLPTTIGMASELEEIVFEENFLAGEIPSEVGMLKDLLRLELQGNSFSGTIPNMFQNMKKLRTLRLDQNNLGPTTLPKSIEDLIALRSIAIHSNPDMNAKIDHIAWDRLSRLRDISAYNAGLIGAVPESMGRIAALKQVLLYDNALTGTLPPDFTQAPGLFMISVESNSMIGLLPGGFGDLPQIRWLGFANNRFVGQIPSRWANSATLETVSLSNNTLQGEIPQAFANSPSLRAFWVEGNPNLFGSLPSGAFCNSKPDQVWVDCHIQGCTPQCNCTCFR